MDSATFATKDALESQSELNEQKRMAREERKIDAFTGTGRSGARCARFGSGHVSLLTTELGYVLDVLN